MNTQANNNNPGNLSPTQHSHLVHLGALVQEITVGYSSLEAIAGLKGFLVAGRLEIPATHRAVRNVDGTLWNIEKTPATLVADRENEIHNAIKRAAHAKTPQTPGFPAVVLARYKANESYNAHSENLALLARHFGTQDEIDHCERRQQGNPQSGEEGYQIPAYVVREINNYYYRLAQLVKDQRRRERQQRQLAEASAEEDRAEERAEAFYLLGTQEIATARQWLHLRKAAPALLDQLKSDLRFLALCLEIIPNERDFHEIVRDQIATIDATIARATQK